VGSFRRSAGHVNANAYANKNADSNAHPYSDTNTDGQANKRVSLVALLSRDIAAI